MSDPSLSADVYVPQPVSAAERRRGVRFSCRPGAEVRFLVKPSFRSRRGYLKDISSGGVAMNLDRPLEEGDIVLLELPVGLKGDTFLKLARVVCVRRHPVGYWLASCSFVHRLGDRQVFDALQRGW